MVSLASQVFAFIIMIVAGLLIGFMFDVYRIIRTLVRPHAKGSLVMDLLFWLAVTPAFFLMLLAGNWGELRFYVFLGTAIGLFVYFQLMSAFVLWLLLTLAYGLGRMVATIIYTVVRLVGKLISLMRSVRMVWMRVGDQIRFGMGRLGRPSIRLPTIHRRLPWGKTWPFGRR